MPAKDSSGTQMSKADSSRIQSSQAKNGGNMSTSGFAAHAQAAGDRNANTSIAGQSTGHTANNTSGENK